MVVSVNLIFELLFTVFDLFIHSNKWAKASLALLIIFILYHALK